MTRIITLAISGIVLLGTSAKADTFDFSFTNTNPPGNVSGTVTGEIILPGTNNYSGAATEVIIESFPSGLNSDLGAAPIDASLWDTQISNSFTEIGGVITSAGFNANQVAGQPLFDQLYIGSGNG